MTGRRYLGLVLLAAAGVLDPGSLARAQATKVPGLVQEGNYYSGNLGMQMQPAPTNADAGAVYSVGPWPTYTPLSRTARKGACAELLRYLSQHDVHHDAASTPSATWEGVVNKMIRTFGAPIPEPSAQAISAYLKSHYTPETRKE